MAMNNKTMNVESKPKSTSQGQGKNTKYSATSRNKAKKAYHRQGKG